MKRASIVACCTFIMSTAAWAQSGGAVEKPPEAPSMTSSATTMAPVAPGSTQMHEVPTPSVDKKSNTIGTGQKLTGRGGN